ncbi:MAG: effector-binding domain-containing protein [Saprospiraceae bacterium]|jgi:effector-binding domain-containing protein
MPWFKKDPAMVLTYGDQTSGIGGNYAWASETQGKGNMKIIEAEAGKSMKTEIEFDGMGTSYGHWTFEPTEDGKVKTTWGMNAPDEVNFFTRGMLQLMGMQKQMNSDFDMGLASLKEVVETQQANLPTTYNGYEVKTIDQPATIYIGTRKELPWAEMTDFYTKTFPAAYGAATSAKSEMLGMPCGLFYKWDEENQRTDMAAGVPVKSAPETLPEGMTAIDVIGGKALQIDYYGAYEGTGKAHEALDKYLADRGWNVVYPVSEQYVTDPTTVDDLSNFLTKITYMYTES